LIDPLDVNNAQQAAYWMEERGLAGFRFHPMYYADVDILTVEANRPLWEELVRLDAVVQFHMFPRDARQVAEIATRYPHLRLIIDHMGYPDVEAETGAFEPILGLARFPNIRLKLSDVKGRSREEFPFRDVHPFISMLHNMYGAERMVWGTGYPGRHRIKHNWLSLADELRLIREGIPFLTPREQDMILGGTAVELWGLSEQY
jgi:L-fuconolactonase